jgi:DNA segregation ATPase FtsK/SpoIIIE-like protein
LVHTIITTLIARNSAQDMELWLCDHKGGVELDRYRELTGSKTRPGIVRRISYQPETTVELLLTAFNEMVKRNEILRQAGSSDVDDYAKMTGQHMRRVVIVIDEIFLLMLNKDRIDPEVGKSSGKGRTIGDWSEHLFAKIASTGRAAGIHLIIATQKTGKDVLTSMITGNFETRIVFGVADMYQSVYLLGDSSAVGLPRGRIIFREEGGQSTEVQTPLIKPDQVRLLINRISRYGPDGGLGRDDEARKFCEDAKLLVTVASEEFDGRLAIAQIWQHDRVKGALRKERVEEIARRLQKDGVLTAGGPRLARMVTPAFLGRPQLLDAMYGPGAAQPGTLPLEEPPPPSSPPPSKA